LKVTLQEIYDFYKKHPECKGKVSVETRHGYYPIDECQITAYDSKVYDVTTSSGKVIGCSPDHLLLSNEISWKKVSDLSVGAFLFSKDGVETVSSIAERDNTEDLYDIEVRDVHEFYANGIVSHNSSLIKSITYALYNHVEGKVTLPNVINNVNKKKCLVTLEFYIGETLYKVSRGRKPDIIKIENLSTGEDITPASTEANTFIQNLIGMDVNSFKYLICFSLDDFIPFVQLPSKDQREIVERILSITKLSEIKKELSEERKTLKKDIQLEQTRLSYIEEQNKEVANQIKQIDDKIVTWNDGRQNKLDTISSKLKSFEDIDVEQQLQLYADIESKIAKATELKSCIDELSLKIANAESERKDKEHKLQSDIVDKIRKYESELSGVQKEIDDTKRKILDIEYKRSKYESDRKARLKDKDALEDDIRALKDGICKECKQSIPADETKLNELQSKLHDIDEKLKAEVEPDWDYTIEGYNKTLDQLSSQAIDIKNKIDESNIEKEGSFSIEKSDEEKNLIAECNKLAEERDEILKSIKAVQSDVTLSKDELQNVSKQIEELTKDYERIEAETNPYIDMEKPKLVDIDNKKLHDMENTLSDYDWLINNFLSDSGLPRRTIAAKAVPYLNKKLADYLNMLNSTYNIKFTDSFDAVISSYGRDISFGNLSAGERQRLNLAISFAFRDIATKTTGIKFDTMFLDEALDASLDESGVVDALNIIDSFVEDGVNVYLISHRQEIIGKFNNIIEVEKKGQFSHINT